MSLGVSLQSRLIVQREFARFTSLAIGGGDVNYNEGRKLPRQIKSL